MMHLNQLVSDALDEAGDEIDFDVVADKVAASIPDGEVDPTLRLLLRSYVANFAGRTRRNLLNPGRAELTEAVLDACDDAPTPGRSRRERYVHVWRRVLDAVVVIEEGKNVKRLGKCDTEDVRCLVGNMARKVSDLQDRQQQFEFLLASMESSKKARLVEDLPPDVIEAFVKGGRS